MKLTNFTDYSLRALVYLSLHPERLCSTKEISNSFNISNNHMVKVLHNLSSQGYIASHKGKGGGFTLSRSSDQLNIGDIVRSIEPDLDIVQCFNIVSNTCKITSACKLKHIFQDAFQAFVSELDKYTIADITTNKEALLELLGD